MRHENVRLAKRAGFDWKAAGYLISIASVIFLGAVAAAKENAPSWYFPVLIIGMLSSIAGMGCRYMAHLHEKRDIEEAKAERS